MPLSEIITLEESRRLVELEEVIERGIKTFMAVGEALAEIRDGRLYRISHATFEDYCNEEWQMTRANASLLIGAAKVGENLSTIVDIPKPVRESQARQLTRLPEPEQQREAWTAAVESAGGEQPTAKQVEAAVETVKAKAEPNHEKPFKPANGLQYATLAIENLKKIQANDTQREAALRKVQQYINTQL